MHEVAVATVIPELWQIAEQQDLYDWQPFRAGIEIHRLYGNMDNGPAAALLRYAAGARLPQHQHAGMEQILVLHGTQSDERGDYPAGTLVINPPGTTHQVSSRDGCIVLALWNKPVRFTLEPVQDLDQGMQHKAETGEKAQCT